MTDYEKAVVMAYTGIAMLTGEKLDIYYQYLYKLFGRPVYSHEIPLLDKNIKERAYKDFIQICTTVTVSPTECTLETIPYPQSIAGKRAFVEKELSPLLKKANTGWMGAEYTNVALKKGGYTEYINLISEDGYRSAPIDVTADSLQALIIDVFKKIVTES